MKVKVNGKWSKNDRPAKANTMGLRAEGIRLDGSNLASLCNLSDRDLCATIRQLSARVNRLPYSGFFGTPTGRDPSWPEIQYGSTHTGRWSSKCPDKSQMPRYDRLHADLSEVRFPYSHALVNADFSEIEKRVAAACGIDPEKMGAQGRFYTAEVQAWQEGKQAKLALELWRQANASLVGFWLHHALKAAVDTAMKAAVDTAMKAAVDTAMKDMQTQIDEEGCGPAIAAIREWNE